jgi:anti-sigma factor RsiW
MSHLDEGTLHALLDGELDLAEVSEIQIHLGTCVACGSRLQEVKQVLAEADRLVGAVEIPAGATRRIPEPPRTSAPRAAVEPDVWNETPVLLLPQEGEASARRARWMKRLRWAAVIAVVVGSGKVITSALRPNEPRQPDRDLTTASPPVARPVLSDEERRPESATVVARVAKPARAASQTRPPSSKLAAKPETTATQPLLADSQGALDSVSLASADTAPADSELLAARETTDTATSVVATAGLAADSAASAKARRDQPSQARDEDDLATRRAAAAALAELDRERRRQRANAATAALPPPRPTEVQPAAESAPRPPSLEQRAQIYLRVGLDEAARQLGQPVHVIEGMTPQFIGLTRGQLLPGGNSRRPVVRVVYLDARDRMILLDQQRLDSSEVAGTPSGNLRWAIGDVMLYLRGEPSPDVLRSLQARVR